MLGTRWLQWFLVPCVVLGALEYAARRDLASVPEWYSAAAVDAAKNHIDVIFVGSSRVAAAVDVRTFETRVALRTRTSVHAVNVGRGFSTLAEHYLGVRNLFAEHPDHLRNCTVFLEAESGLSLPARWQDPWVQSSGPQLLVPLLRWRDLWGFAQSGSTRNEKITIVTRFLVQWSMLVTHHEHIREVLLSRAQSWLEGALSTVTAPLTVADASANGMLDLSSAGGIRIGRSEVDEIREVARAGAKTRLEDQTPAGSWEGSIQADFMTFLKENGADPVFFRTPESSIFSVGYATDVRRRDRASFEEQVKKWGTVILEPRFSFDDGDFPDLMHLRRSRKAVFTDRLIDAWLASRENRADSNAGRP